ncbi:far-red impaired response 1-like protein [Sesbania bispinosa]|nr:far-red impaired response 1-like protein [Sesbania bispinosa]
MRDICPRLIRIATEACNHQETFMFLRKVVDELDRHMLEFQKRQISNTQDNEFLSKGIEIASIGDCSTQVKGFKKKEGKKGSKRMKGWVERQLSKKRKKNGDSSVSQNQEPIKNNEGEKGLTCMKGWVEQHVTKQRKNDATNASQSQEPTMSNEPDSSHNLMVTQVQYEVPDSSAPKWLNDVYNQQSMEDIDPLSQFGVNSFTSLLMAQLDEDYTTLTKP